jgi:hypothetical protein
MPNRNRTQGQDQQQKGRQNPGTFSPEDDEDLEPDPTLTGAQESQQNRRKPAQQDTGPVSDIEYEEAEDDEDDEDGLGARPG